MKKVTFVKDLINRFIEHPLFAGSFIMVVGSNLTNFIAYIYHLILGRMLGPAQYGVLVATISLIGMFSITFGFLGLVIIKFVSASGAEQLDKILSWFNRKSLLLGAFLLLLSFIATPFLSGFLKISPTIIVLVAPIVFVSLLTYVYKSFLQGLLKFKETVIASNVEFLLR
ncbi:MAG: oligosaccharide flippase family protein, partial [bacterium]